MDRNKINISINTASIKKYFIKNIKLCLFFIALIFIWNYDELSIDHKIVLSGLVISFYGIETFQDQIKLHWYKKIIERKIVHYENFLSISNIIINQLEYLGRGALHREFEDYKEVGLELNNNIDKLKGILGKISLYINSSTNDKLDLFEQSIIDTLGSINQLNILEGIIKEDFTPENHKNYNKYLGEIKILTDKLNKIKKDLKKDLKKEIEKFK